MADYDFEDILFAIAITGTLFLAWLCFFTVALCLAAIGIVAIAALLGL